MKGFERMVLRSDGGDVHVQFGRTGVIVTLLGHSYGIIWHPDLRQYMRVRVQTEAVVGHDISAVNPADCPGCREFVHTLDPQRRRAAPEE